MLTLELESDLSNSGVYDSTSDSDICDYSEISKIFKQADNICEKIITKNNYILGIDATSECEPNVAVTVSDNSSCKIYKLSNQQVAILTTLNEYQEIIDCKFSKQDYDLIYVCSRNGSIALWDIRTPKKSVANFSGIFFIFNKNMTP
ncbi:uncharacterized protein LOC108915188 isoform X1 [Anoplophora glabripennis]|uniref:uncharacterized protein LOC108915188 isoform X1 n=1 Tax=Anoplophora glabripennis TaxID=217634 RepID=UPI000874C9DB|nr:uncharacterized protein LOC108915188 isoform X1 [Anoplophora glabripennis]